MTESMIAAVRLELKEAQTQQEEALLAWDRSVADLWRTSLALTQAQKRVMHALELLRLDGE